MLGVGVARVSSATLMTPLPRSLRSLLGTPLRPWREVPHATTFVKGEDVVAHDTGTSVSALAILRTINDSEELKVAISNIAREANE